MTIIRILTDKGVVTHVCPRSETVTMRKGLVAAIAKWGQVISVTVKDCP